MPRQTASVFISGTFSDMAPWRAAATQGINAADMVARDLAHMVKDGRRTIEFIEHELARNDIYIGVFGLRYGERVDALPDAPSWTHYEYLYFFNRLLKLQQLDGLLPMLVLEPEQGSDAHDLISAAAQQVLATLAPVVAESDRAAQEAFLKTIREGGNFLNHAVLHRLEVLNLSHDTSSRLVERYGTETDLRQRVVNFLQRHEIQLLRTEIATLAAQRQAPPAAPHLPGLPADAVARLRVAAAEPAVCVLTQPGGGADAASTARALAFDNPPGAEDADAHIDLANARLDPAMGDDAIRAMMLDLIGGVFDFDAADGEDVFAALAEHILWGGGPAMLHVAAPRLASFNLGAFATRLWQPLAQALNRVHREQGAQATAETGAAGRLFLILSSERAVHPATLRRSYQPCTGKPLSHFEKPVLLTAGGAAQEIPSEPERAPDRATI